MSIAAVVLDVKLGFVVASMTPYASNSVATPRSCRSRFALKSPVIFASPIHRRDPSATKMSNSCPFCASGGEDSKLVGLQWGSRLREGVGYGKERDVAVGTGQLVDDLRESVVPDRLGRAVPPALDRLADSAPVAAERVGVWRPRFMAQLPKGQGGCPDQRDIPAFGVPGHGCAEGLKRLVAHLDQARSIGRNPCAVQRHAARL